MRSHVLTISMLLSSTVSLAQFPPSVHFPLPDASVALPLQHPANCTVIFDAELGQMDPPRANDPVENFNSTLGTSTLYDLLAADDFISARAGRITDVFTYSRVISNRNGVPADGVRVYLWGTDEAPSENPTLVLNIPLNQIRIRSIWDQAFQLHVVIHVPDLDIPFGAGRTWITVQPRDESPDGGFWAINRSFNQPLQGADAYVKDGPNGEGGWGFTDWRPAGELGFHEPADSLIKIIGCFDPTTNSVEGECGGAAQFSWSNAPPESTLTFLYAKQTGGVRIPPNLPCGGTQLGLGQRRLQVAFSVETGEGSGMAERFLPAAACPGYFQALLRAPTGPCEVSNVVETP